MREKKELAEERQEARGAPCTVFCKGFAAPRGAAGGRGWRARKQQVHVVLFFAMVFEEGDKKNEVEEGGRCTVYCFLQGF